METQKSDSDGDTSNPNGGGAHGIPTAVEVSSQVTLADPTVEVGELIPNGDVDSGVMKERAVGLEIAPMVSVEGDVLGDMKEMEDSSKSATVVLAGVDTGTHSPWKRGPAAGDVQPVIDIVDGVASFLIPNDIFEDAEL